MHRVSEKDKLKSALLLVQQEGKRANILCNDCVCSRYNRHLKQYKCCGIQATTAGKTANSDSYCLDYAARYLMTHGHADVALNSIL